MVNPLADPATTTLEEAEHQDASTSWLDQPHEGSGLREILMILRRKRAALDTIGLSKKVRDLVTKLRANHDRQRQEATESWAIRRMFEAYFANILHHTILCKKKRRRGHDNAQAEMLDARAAIHLAQQHIECLEN